MSACIHQEQKWIQVPRHKSLDEPSHEIYANLMGIKVPLKKVVHSNQASTPSTKYSQDIVKIGDASVIPINNELQEESNQYTSIYRKRLAEPVEVSQLSLDKSNKGIERAGERLAQREAMESYVTKLEA